jgi:SAM-dependent methyltransferase
MDKTTFPDEMPELWSSFDKSDLELRCAVLHKFRRIMAETKPQEEVDIVRRTVAHIFIRGTGIEVGAGSRPFPIPSYASCSYGDIRDQCELHNYFGTEIVGDLTYIDAGSMRGIPHNSLDFIISAHVIEHLHNPIRALKEAIYRLKKNGIFLLVVPEMTKTFDCRRPPTSLKHVLDDELDDGAESRLQAYIEHCKYVHPEITGNALSDADIN